MLDVVNGIKKFNVGNISIKEECTRELNWLKSLKDRVQPKQEWSEEDLSMIGRIRSIIEKYAFSQSAVDVNGELCEKEFIDADNWLKSLKDRVQPQPKQEWSEEDIVAIDCAVEVLSKDLPSLAASIERLKSLRPQNRWKPSDEQMKALLWIIENTPKSVDINILLNSLYEQLKAL
jgi:hypothetical protein